jgi:transposase
MLKNAKRAEQIGTTVIEQLDIPPVRVVVQRMTCPIYRLHLQGGIRTRQTVTPPGVIDRGQVSDRFLVASVIDKVQDHLPAYRQETRFARAGAAVPRSKLCRWHMSAADFLAPVAEAILDEIRSEPTIGIDDSVHRLVVPDRHVCKQGRLIAVGGPPGIFYQFQPTREAKWFAQLMAPYSGVVMGDACSSHKQFLARDDILALFCWAHARRKFHEAGDKRRRKIVIEMIAKLYAIEDDIADMTLDGRVEERRRRAGPVLAQIHELLTSWRDERAVLPQTGIGKAVRYVLDRWDGFTAYLDVGSAPIDNNHIERGMRANAMHRKNSLFSASLRGAESYATLLTLTQSAWLKDLDPHAYLLDVIDAMHHDRSPVAQLTPAVYAKAGRCLVGKPS